MKICFAQINPTVGDISGNAKRIISAINSAKGQGADIVLFPELAVVGYPPNDLLLKKKFVDDNLWAIEEIKENCNGITAVVGFVDRKGEQIFNSAAVIQNKNLVGVQHKTNLPNYDVFDEKRYFASAEEQTVFDFNGTKFGITICEDIWHDGPVEGLKKKGAQLILNLSASPYTAGKERIREQEVLSVRASKNSIPIAYCNIVGGQDEILFDGRSYFFDASGKKVFEAPEFEEGLFMYNSSQKPTHIDADTSEISNIFKALVLGIKDYFRKNGFKKAVIGLSGGIDSALVASLATEALGKENVLGITMPSKYSSTGSVDDSQELANNLEISFKRIPIGKVFDAYLGTLADEFRGHPENLAEENLQARIRGTLLMAISNKFGHLVLTTGNKSEVACGYCTLYGDTCGGLASIADLPKTKVYELARYFNQLKGRQVIPENTFTKAPSAELRPNQKDSDSLPEYDILDQILDLYVEKGLSKDEIISKGFDKATVERVMRLVKTSEYKRRQLPPGLKVTAKAFGIGRRIPITNGWDE
jgi:NAD+ synthase (glutamine-hydrolysing)